MPILPPLTGSTYDTVNVVLNMTRGRIDDELLTLQASSTQLLDNSQARTQQIFNTAWRKCQAFLAEKGYARLIDETVIYSLPVVASTDPAVQCWLGWTGFYDGLNLNASLVLPAGLNHPLKIWERWSGNNAQFGDPPMEKFLDGLPATSKTTANRFWEWRNDAIYMPGALMIEDLRIRYVSFFADIVDVGGSSWIQQPVPIARVADGLSWFICAELALADKDYDVAAACKEQGESELMRVFNLDVRADQRVNIRRQPRTGRGFGRSWY